MYQWWSVSSFVTSIHFPLVFSQTLYFFHSLNRDSFINFTLQLRIWKASCIFSCIKNFQTNFFHEVLVDPPKVGWFGERTFASKQSTYYTIIFRFERGCWTRCFWRSWSENFRTKKGAHKSEQKRVTRIICGYSPPANIVRPYLARDTVITIRSALFEANLANMIVDFV